MHRRLPIRALVVWLVLPVSLAAQSPGRPRPGTYPTAPGTSVQESFLTVAVNAALGSVTVGVTRLLRGRPVWSGLPQGALGGGLVFLGKRAAVERFFGAGLVGRQVAAIGSSIVRNAADGRPGLQTVVLPLGPARFYVRPRSPEPVRVRMELYGLAYLVASAIDRDKALDPAESLSAGAPVFRVYDDDADAVGAEDGGVIYLYLPNAARGPEWSPAAADREEREATAAHERVHVLQDDQMFMFVSLPLERAAVRRLPAVGAYLDRYTDLGTYPLVWRLLAAPVDYEDQPWEREAEFLSRVPR